VTHKGSYLEILQFGFFLGLTRLKSKSGKKNLKLSSMNLNVASSSNLDNTNSSSNNNRMVDLKDEKNERWKKS